MASQTPTLDIFVAAIREFREAVADPSYDETTARVRLVMAKSMIIDAGLVEDVRGIITDIDKELHTTSDSLSTARTKDEKKMFMLQTIGYVVEKAFGKGESNESPPEAKDLIASIFSDKETEMHVGGSTTSQGKEENIKPALSEVANGNGMSEGENTLVEGATTNEGKEKQIESDLTHVIEDHGMSREHTTLVEGATTDEGKENQTKPNSSDVVIKKGTGRVRDMLHDMLSEGPGIDPGMWKQTEAVVEGPKKMNRKRKLRKKNKKRPTEDGTNDSGKGEKDDDFVEASTLDKGKGKESEPYVKGAGTDQDRKDEIGLRPAEDEIQGEETNINREVENQKTVDLAREALAADLGSISDQDSGIRVFFTGRVDNVSPQDVIESRQDASKSIRKMLALLKLAIRPQTATPWQLDLFCRYVEDPILFSKMSQTVEELRWNR